MNTITGANDPVVLYLIVRESLDMSAGKAIAQGGHGVEHIIIHYFKTQLIQAKLHHTIPGEENHIEMTRQWLLNRSRKVVLKADEKQWLRIKEQFPDCIVIKDDGLTEVEPGTETCITLWPNFKSKFSETIVKKLQAVKGKCI